MFSNLLELNKHHYLDLLKWINHNGGRVLYPERIICSRYFDNNNMQIYFNTVEGIIPRKKIRIREYPNSDDKKYYFENTWGA